MDYKNKYLKYKQKYINYKNILSGAALRWHYRINIKGKDVDIPYSREIDELINRNSIYKFDVHGYKHTINLLDGTDSTKDSYGNSISLRIKQNGSSYWQFEKIDRKTGGLTWFSFTPDTSSMINRLNTFDVDVNVNGKLYRHNINIFNREVYTTNSFGMPMVLRLIQKQFDEKIMPVSSLVKPSTSKTSGLASSAVSGLAGLASSAVSSSIRIKIFSDIKAINPFVSDQSITEILQNIESFTKSDCLQNGSDIHHDELYSYKIFMKDYIIRDIQTFNPIHPQKDYKLDDSYDPYGKHVPDRIVKLPQIDRYLPLRSYQKESNPFFVYIWSFSNDIGDKSSHITTSVQYKFEQALENQSSYNFTQNGNNYRFIPICFNTSYIQSLYGIVVNLDKPYEFILLYRYVRT